MYRRSLFHISVLICNVLFLSSAFAQSDREDVDKGRYLITIAGCNDCHTAEYPESGGKVPESQWLKGSSIGYQGPWGTTYPANLRLSVANMSEEQFIARSRSEMLPPMPWFNLLAMSDDDLRAIYRYINNLGEPGGAAPAYVPPDIAPVTPYIVFVPQQPARH